MKKLLLNPWTALLTLVVVLFVRYTDPEFVESVRLRYFDQLITNQEPVPIPVHTVNIDEAALEKFGQFPFPRGTYAQIIHELYSRNAGLVVFNVMMPEHDRFKEDGQLAAILKQYPVILPSVGSQVNKNIPRKQGVGIVGNSPEGLVVEYPGVISNIPLLNNNAAGVGHANTFPEVDGVVRRMPLVIYSNEQLHSAMALETLRVAAGDPSFQIKLGPAGVEALRIPKFGKIESDSISRIWVDWSKQAQQHSLTKLPTDFRGEIVIVGLSAAGLSNPVATSRGEVWPQDMQASILGTLITQTNITRPGYADQLELAAIAIAGILLVFLMRWTYVGLVTSIVIVGGIIASSIYAYDTWLFLFDATLPAVGLTLVALHAYMSKFLSEFLQKQQIKQQFGSYVNPVIVERLQKHPEFIKLGGEKKDLTIIMSDMRNFTGLGETYGDDVVAFTQTMNRYMTAIAEPVLRNNGCLIKFIGDASLHVHGAPIQEEQDPDHAHAAIRTGLEMIQAVELFNLELEKENKPKVGMGIGINTGPTLIGNIGSKDRFAYDVLGDSVSLTARLEGQTKNYGQLIIISEFTEQRVNDAYFTLHLDCIAVKGKNIGINIYTVFYNPDVTVAADWIMARETHNTMLQHYRNQDWGQAKLLVNELIGEFDGRMDDYYSIWLERIDTMSATNLPHDWDGIYRASSK